MTNCEPVTKNNIETNIKTTKKCGNESKATNCVEPVKTPKESGNENKGIYCVEPVNEPDTNRTTETKTAKKCENETKATAQQTQLFEVLTKALQLYKPNEIMLSFNGGKDCMVLLHSITTFLKRNTCLKDLRLPVLYIQSEDAFVEIDMFVEECSNKYDIELLRRRGTIKQALLEVCKERPLIKAVFLGSRRTDPHCDKLNVFQATDPGWPPLMRINPIIEWSCKDVWNYLLCNEVPYCSLYDIGYTSLGTKKNTNPNPHLMICDLRTGYSTYKPAYEMPDDDKLERAGRT